MDDRLVGGPYEPCADRSLDRRGVARLMGEVRGPDIAAEVADKPGTGSPITTMFADDHHHGLAGNPLVRRAILRREQRTLRAFFQEFAATVAAGP